MRHWRHGVSNLMAQAGTAVLSRPQPAHAILTLWPFTIAMHSDPGLADLAVVVLAFRYRTTRLLTLGERDFRQVEPLQGDAFRLLPTDS